MITPFPLAHSTQVAEKSIEDAFNRQTYLGNSFILGTGAISLVDTSEHSELLILNSSISGKALFIIAKRISASAPVFAKLYLNPTISANGTPATANNLRPAYNTVSVATCFSAPSFSSNTNLISTIGATAGGFGESPLLYILDPGNNVAITFTSTTGAALTPTICYFEMNWYEI